MGENIQPDGQGRRPQYALRPMAIPFVEQSRRRCNSRGWCRDRSKFAILSAGASITAVDFSGNMLKFAREKAVKLHKTVALEEMDVQTLEFLITRSTVW